MGSKSSKLELMRLTIKKAGMEGFSETLSQQQDYVLHRRVTGEETLKAVGTVLNVTRERVRQIEQDIFNKMMRYRAALDCRNHIGEEPIEFIQIPCSYKNRLYKRGIMTTAQIRKIGIEGLSRQRGIGRSTISVLRDALGDF